MCDGVRFRLNGVEMTVYFPQPGAVLPVRMKGGAPRLIPWGRREAESGELPVGGWAQLESIKQGRWDRYFPKPVKLVLHAFMEKDLHGRAHWYPCVVGYVQGLVARECAEERVYVVTIRPTLPEQVVIHHRWPRIIFASEFVPLSQGASVS